jgi:branched-subunit amino acid aminotransferase/4-amino-4-deoxychorismate lyase
MEEPQAYLNGRFLCASMAAVSPVDAGFVQGATVTEQLRTFGGKLFHLEEHLARLERSLRIVDVDPGMTRVRFAEVARELVAHNYPLLDPADDLGLSIFVTPGTYPGYAEPGPNRPTVCLHTYPLPFRLWAAKYRTGQSLVTSDVRQVPPQCWPPALKCRSRMHYYLADRRAAQVGPGARALLLDLEGYVTEASTANVVVYDPEEGLISPPPEVALEGISLAVVARLASELGLRWARRGLRPEHVAAAQEVLLTSTPFCLLPVTRLDSRPIGRGVPGPVFGRLLAAWSGRVGVDVQAQAERFAAREF